jgi:hypothetical protein
MLLGSIEGENLHSSLGDSSRRRIVNMILVVYVLLIVEGALRKWVFPEFGQLLYFVRDPFVAVTYAMALASGNWPRSSPWLAGALLIALLGLVVAVLQLVLGFGNPQSPIVFAAYGMRNYFFYIPLAFIIAETFRLEDLARVARITLVFVIASAGLVILQFYSPVDSPINLGSSDNPLLQFRGLGLTGETTRPMGFFTSDTGQKQLVVSALAFVIAIWGGVFARARVAHFLLPFATVAVLACLAFSGSRGAVLSSGLVIIAAIFALTRGGVEVGRGRLLWVLLALVIIAAIVAPLFFSDGIEAFVARWTDANIVERQGIFGRTLYGFIDFTRLLSGTPLLGFGIGMGGNAATMAAAASGGQALPYYAETDWARHIVDLGPVLGLAFMVFRIGLVLELSRRVVQSRSVLATLLFGYLAYELLTGQITGQGTINGYAWMFTGFTLAAAASVARRESFPRAAQPTIDRFPNLMG